MEEIVGESVNLKGSVSEIIYKDKHPKYIDSQQGKDFRECVNDFIELKYSYLKFDEFGRIVLIYMGGIKVQCFYDEEGPLKECFIQTPGYGEPNEKTYYDYNSCGLISKETRYNYGVWIDDFESDLRTEIKEEGVLSEIIKRFYNPDNRLIKIVKYNNKEVKQTINNKYDLNGNIIEQINIHKNGSFGNYHKYFEYNSKNLVVKKQWKYWFSNAITDTVVTMNNYEEYCLVDNTRWGNKNIVSTVFTAKYNHNSDLVELAMIVEQTSDGKVISEVSRTIFYEYLYDEYDNWISKTGSINGVDVVKVERKINYYGNN
jgi:hypothetical protein